MSGWPSSPLLSQLLRSALAPVHSSMVTSWLVFGARSWGMKKVSAAMVAMLDAIRVKARVGILKGLAWRGGSSLSRCDGADGREVSAAMMAMLDAIRVKARFGILKGLAWRRGSSMSRCDAADRRKVSAMTPSLYGQVKGSIW